MSLLASVKGWIGEAYAASAQALFLDPKTYVSLNNVTLPTKNGTTQIDHVIVSRFGIFVIETKNMKGWIFGDEKSSQWTQALPAGRKFRFQNPLRQNYRHIQALAEFLGIVHDKLHSVVMFWGESEFKTPMPDNVLDRHYATYIRSKQDILFTDDEVTAIVDALKTGRLPKTWATRKAHIASLKERIESTTTCPKCGKPLVLRTARSGTDAGRQFLGCAGFPACRFTEAQVAL